MRANTGKINRKTYFTLLAVGKAELKWDDEFYYEIWLPEQGATLKGGKYSATTLSDEQLIQALKNMKRSGFKVQHANSKKATKPKSRALADDAQSKMIRALWLELHAVGGVRDSSERALMHWITGQTKSSDGIEALQWLSSEQASRLIEQLKKWLQRIKKKAA
ncbi:MAG: regulatory protein GemA [Methylobacter tundripaludum]|nr:regulatory protein GemA [Methylobacter tundripaludum]